MTQSYQFGTYNLPSIDMKDLLAKKRALINPKK
jgi:hypothetical protein